MKRNVELMSTLHVYLVYANQEIGNTSKWNPKMEPTNFDQYILHHYCMVTHTDTTSTVTTICGQTYLCSSHGAPEIPPMHKCWIMPSTQ